MDDGANRALEFAVILTDFTHLVDQQSAFLKSFEVDASLKRTFVRTGLAQVRMGARSIREAVRRKYGEYAPAKTLLSSVNERMQELEDVARYCL